MALDDPYAVRPGLKAYDLEMLHRFVDPADDKGRVFGLPPAIGTDRWPLDTVSGYPLMHGFTLRLPEDHRVHGPDVVGFSFFAPAPDQNDVGANKRLDVRAAVLGAEPVGPENAWLRRLREYSSNGHPRLHRMTDALGYAYAVILLDADEFGGPATMPPDVGASHHPDMPPEWLSSGSAHVYLRHATGIALDDPRIEATRAFRMLGGIPEPRLDWHRAVSWTPRAYDPNAGIPPSEVYDDESELGYKLFYDPDNGCEELPWAKALAENHIGGTMKPLQETPRFSAFYVAFEEYFGGYNFGGGNAQLDFLRMEFDWACG